MSYTILPFQFERTSNNDILLVNECGDFTFLPEKEFNLFISHKLPEDSEYFYNLKSHLIVAQNEIETSIEKISNRLRSRKSFLCEFSYLHMMVITLRCNQKCKYCQVSCAEEDAYKYDMSDDTARKIVDMIFQAPTMFPKIEFQGGEPTLNWNVITTTVEYAEKIAKEKNKNVEFVICSNLTTITEEQLKYCKKHNICISTSLDGSRDIHNKCRVTKQGNGTYDTFLEKLTLARKYVGFDMVGALMTTSAYSLNRMKEVIDEYVKQGMDGIFIRSLNPYGFAAEDAENLSYSMDDFVDNYFDALKYIFEINKKVYFPELFAKLLFSRILTPFSTGFVDLQSPAGAGISGVIYDFDGSVFPSDEARMLARMGDRHFCLGNVYTESYKDIFAGDKLKNITSNSCVEITPPCAYCGYQAYCGCDPVRNYLESGNELRNMSNTPFCKKHKKIISGLFDILRNADKTTKNIIWSWITNNPDLVKK